MARGKLKVPLKAILILAIAIILLIPTLAAAWDGPGVYMTWVSTNEHGSQYNNTGIYGCYLGGCAMSADGRYIAFGSDASNLVSGDTNNMYDVFRKDLASGEIVRASTDSFGNQANLGSHYSISISANGRYVAFRSSASNLVPGDTNLEDDIFRKDLTTGAIIRVSVDSNNHESYSESHELAMSADGYYVAFRSDGLVPGDTNLEDDIFRKDLTTGAIIRVSVDSSGNQADDDSSSPSISADGRYIAFCSNASNLTPGDTNGKCDVFRKDLTTGAIIRVSVASNGDQINANSMGSTISSDGRYIAFVSGEYFKMFDVFRKDLTTGAIIRVSVASNGDQANADSLGPKISADGRHVTFESIASNLIPGDTNGKCDVFRKDLTTGAIIRVSVASNGDQANSNSSGFTMSADGRFVTFKSSASNLVSGDTNGVWDVFLADMSHYPGLSSCTESPEYKRLWAADFMTEASAGLVLKGFMEDNTGFEFGKDQQSFTLFNYAQERDTGIGLGGGFGFALEPVFTAKAIEADAWAKAIQVEGEEYEFNNLPNDRNQQLTLAALVMQKLTYSASCRNPIVKTLIEALDPGDSIFSLFRVEKMTGGGIGAEGHLDILKGSLGLEGSPLSVELINALGLEGELVDVFTRHVHPASGETSYRGKMSAEGNLEGLESTVPALQVFRAIFASGLNLNGSISFEEEVYLFDGAAPHRLVFRLYNDDVCKEYVVNGYDNIMKLSSGTMNITAMIQISSDLSGTGKAAVMFHVLPIEFNQLLANAKSQGIEVQFNEYNVSNKESIKYPFKVSLALDVDIDLGVELDLTKKTEYLSQAGVYGSNTECYESPDASSETIKEALDRVFQGLWDYVKDSVVSATKQVGEQVGSWVINTGKATLRGMTSITSNTVITIRNFTDRLNPFSAMVQSASLFDDEKTHNGLRIIGDIISLEPAGYVLENPANLELTYADLDALGFDEAKFSIFRFDEINDVWQPIPSIMDANFNKVSADITVLGTYVIGVDQSAPVIELNKPNSMYGNSHDVAINAWILDQAAGLKADSIVVKIDGNSVSSTYDEPGKTINATASALSDGEHEILIKASDVLGNQAEKLASINIDTLPPLPPTKPTSRRTQNRVYLAWSASPSQDADHYNIYRDTELNGELMNYAFSDSTKFEDLPISSDNIHYEIRAADKAGNESEPIVVSANPAITGDVNGDHVVNIFDLVIIGRTFGSTPLGGNWNFEADLNKDEVVNIFDLVVVGTNFGKSNSY